MRSMYEVKVIEGVICITDLGGMKSVTNDIEAIIGDLARAGLSLNAPIVYRDSDGNWDGVLVENGAFKGFRILADQFRQEAMAAIKQFTKEVK